MRRDLELGVLHAKLRSCEEPVQPPAAALGRPGRRGRARSGRRCRSRRGNSRAAVTPRRRRPTIRRRCAPARRPGRRGGGRLRQTKKAGGWSGRSAVAIDGLRRIEQPRRARQVLGPGRPGRRRESGHRARTERSGMCALAPARGGRRAAAPSRRAEAVDEAARFRVRRALAGDAARLDLLSRRARPGSRRAPSPRCRSLDRRSRSRSSKSLARCGASRVARAVPTRRPGAFWSTRRRIRSSRRTPRPRLASRGRGPRRGARTTPLQIARARRSARRRRPSGGDLLRHQGSIGSKAWPSAWSRRSADVRAEAAHHRRPRHGRELADALDAETLQRSTTRRGEAQRRDREAWRPPRRSGPAGRRRLSPKRATAQAAPGASATAARAAMPWRREAAERGRRGAPPRRRRDARSRRRRSTARPAGRARPRASSRCTSARARERRLVLVRRRRHRHGGPAPAPAPGRRPCRRAGRAAARPQAAATMPARPSVCDGHQRLIARRPAVPRAGSGRSARSAGRARRPFASQASRIQERGSAPRQRRRSTCQRARPRPGAGRAGRGGRDAPARDGGGGQRSRDLLGDGPPAPQQRAP